MIHLFLNGLGASAGAGLTYLYNVIPQFSRLPDVHTTIAVQSRLQQQFEKTPNVTAIPVGAASSLARRFWFEQRDLPDLIRESGADVLICAGNFALRESPVPQILLSGNSLYTSRDFDCDVRGRREYRMWLDTRIRGSFAYRSIHWADCTVAPTQAFAEELRRWSGKEVLAIHHGFDHALFFRDQSPLPSELRQKLNGAEDCLKLLFVSHYNYYRNFETLLRALPLIRAKLKGAKVRLFLTCKLQEGNNPGSYRTATAAALISQLAIREEVVELGAVPYPLLHQLYRACDVYVTPAYTETFAHPLVEAMASRLPIVASDLPVHREVCGDAAVFFDRFSPQGLAEELTLLTSQGGRRAELVSKGERRAMDFSWSVHVRSLIEISNQLVRQRHPRLVYTERVPAPEPT